jgi:hypothetical protein
MHSTIKLFKFILWLTLAFATIVFCCAIYLSKSPVNISNQLINRVIKHYAAEYHVNCNDAVLGYDKGNFVITLDKATLENGDKQTINFKNLKHIFNIYSLSGTASAQIYDSNLLNHIPIYQDQQLKTIINEFNQQHEIKFNGDLTASFFLFNLNSISINLSSSLGIHTPKKILPPIAIDKFSIKAFYTKNNLKIEQFELKYNNNIYASLDGVFSFNHAGLKSAKFSSKIFNFPIEYLEGLWPKFLFPEVHEWVNSNVKGGVIDSAQGIFDFSEKDLYSLSLVSKESVAAEINVRNTNLIFDPSFTKISGIDGVIKINGHNLNLQATKANYINTQLSQINLDFGFDKMDLALKTKFAGQLSGFKEFMPKQAITKLKTIAIDYDKIAGFLAGDFTLNLPIENNFDIRKLKFAANAEIKNAIFDQQNLFKIDQGSLELANDNECINLKIFQNKNKAIDIINHHDEQKQAQDKIAIDLNIAIAQEFNIQNFYFQKGLFNLKLDINEDNWAGKLDLTKAQIIIKPLGYIKEEQIRFLLSCNGKVNQNNEIISDECGISGDKAHGNIKLEYAITDNLLRKLQLSNFRFGPNIINLNIDKTNHFFNASLSAKFVDLSNFELESTHAQATDNYIFNFKIEQALLKNNILLDSFNGSVKQFHNKPPEIAISAKSEQDKISFIKTYKNDKDFYSLYSSSASMFTKAFGISNNIKKGELLLEFIPKIIDHGIGYEGKIKVNNFYLSNTSVLSKIILGILSPLNSPQAMAQSFQGGSLKADIATADLNFSNGVLNVSNGYISGPSYSMKLEGMVNLEEHYLAFKGIYIPSFYGINTFISMLPLFGKLLAGGDKSAFLAANFSFKGKFSDVKTYFHPISVLTPGFLRNIFN